jgi:AraC-like DNA-binding protein
MIPQLISKTFGQLDLINDPLFHQAGSGESGHFICLWKEGNIKLHYQNSGSFTSVIFQIIPKTGLSINLSFDLHVFSLIFCFGQSCLLETSDGKVMILHDRGGTALKGSHFNYQINLSGEGPYVFIFLLYTQTFIEEYDLGNHHYFDKNKPIDSGFLYPKPVVSTIETIENLSVFMNSGLESEVATLTRKEAMRSLFKQFSNQTDRVAFQPTGIPTFEMLLFYKSRNQLLEWVTKKLSYTQLLFKAGIPRAELFRKRIKQLYGITTREYITEMRLAYALKLLSNPTHSIKEIAWKTGFPSIQYFDRLFVKYFRLSPNLFRKEHFFNRQAFAGDKHSLLEDNEKET